MKRLFIIALFIMAAVACNGWKPPPAPVPPKDTEDCPAACEKLRSLGCPEGEPLEDGTTCEVWCKQTQDSGHALRPSCVVTITDCKQLHDCAKGAREVME